MPLDPASSIAFRPLAPQPAPAVRGELAPVLQRVSAGARAVTSTIQAAAALLLQQAAPVHRPPAISIPAALIGTTQRAGEFLITIRIDQRSGLPMLEIRHARNPDRIVASTVPGESFLMVGTADRHVTDQRGHFRFRHTTRHSLQRQIVDTFQVDGTAVVLSGTFAEQHGVRWQVRFAPAADHRLGFEATTVRAGASAALVQRTDQIHMSFASAPDESYFGFGMQGTHLDLRGHRVPILRSEQGIGRGRQPLTFLANSFLGVGGDAYMGYATLPHFITSANRSLFLEQDEPSTFDLRDPRRVTIEVDAGTMHGQLISGSTPKELVSRYTEHAGRPRELPAWVHEGAIVSVQGGTQRVREVEAQLRAAGTPLAGMWMQDWPGKRDTGIAKQLWWNWELDSKLYAGWNELRRELADRGTRVLTYLNPMLVDVTGKDGVTRNLYKEAERLGYLVHTDTGEVAKIPNTTFHAGLIDLSDPKAREWYKDVIKEHLHATGTSGFMADYGEALPFDASLDDGVDAATWHGRYPDAWAKLVREALDELGRDDVVAFHRSAGAGKGARNDAALMWTGDQLVTWDRHDGLRSALTLKLSGGLSGFALTHSDVGGYTTVDLPLVGVRRSPELLKRWTELSAFSTMLRTHEGSKPEANAQVWDDESARAHFARMSQVFAELAPYRKQLVAEAARTGIPVMRHPWLEHPDDPVARTLTDQFMLGSELLVAPTMTPGAASVKVYLPAGEWVHVFTGERFGSATKGTWVTISTPLGQPAALYPAGSTEGEALRRRLLARGLAR